MSENFVHRIYFRASEKAIESATQECSFLFLTKSWEACYEPENESIKEVLSKVKEVNKFLNRKEEKVKK